MKAKGLTALLALAVVALAVLAFVQHRTIRELRSELAVAEASQPSVAGAARADGDCGEPVAAGSASTTQATPAFAPESASTPAPASTSDSASVEREAESTSARRVMRDFAKMLENPQMNEVMKASQRATLEVLYKDLLDAYGLSAEERAHFMELLMARQMFRVETSMKMMGGGNDAEEMKALADEMREYDQLVKAEIDMFLNNKDDSAEFEFHEKTMGERMALSGLKAELARAQIPLADDIDRQLIEIMARQKAAHRFTSDLADEQNYNLDATRFSEANIIAFEQDLTEVNAAIAGEARAILTDQQHTAFVRALQQMQQVQLSQLRMAANMFGAAPKSRE